jgi:hypothetical protein
MVDVGISGRLRQPQAGAGGEEGGQGAGQFQPRERRPEAEMDAGAEARVGLRRAGGVEPVRLGMGRGVAVGRGEQARHLVARREAVAEDLHLLPRDAGEDVQRRVEAQDLLDRAGGVGERGLHARLDQRLHPVAQAVHRRLVPRVQQQDDGRDQFLGAQPVARGLGRDQLAEQVVAGAAPPRRDHLAEEGCERFGRRRRRILVGAGPAGLVHPDHRVRPGQQVGRAGVGHADEAGDDGHGQGAGERVEQVEAPLGEGRDQLGHQPVDLRRQRLHAGRGKGAQDEAAQAGVAGRLGLEHRMRLDCVEWRQPVRDLWPGRALGRLAAEAAVAQDRAHRPVGRGRGHPVLPPPHQIAGRAGTGVEGIGILHEGGLGGRLRQALHALPHRAAPRARQDPRRSAARNRPPTASDILAECFSRKWVDPLA